MVRSMSETYTIGALARLARVTVRTLHHYDAIGLLEPSGRSEAGYRLYVRADLERLLEIRTWRELGLSLEAIQDMLDDPEVARADMLRTQRQALLERIEESHRLITTIDGLLLAEGATMSDQDLFGAFDAAEYEDEAAARWGHSEAVRQSQARFARYTPDDIERMKREMSERYRALAALRAEGVPPDDPRATAEAERHRMLTERWCYDCPPALHLGLADLYEGDARFAKTIDRAGEGTTTYPVAAIRALHGV